jgi:hypothetical protein
MATHIWARASFDREQLVPLAPDGYEPVVEVFLHGRPDPIVPSFVETRNDGWVRFQATSSEPGESGEGKWHYSDSLLHSHTSSIARVEIRFRKVRPSRGPVGFSYGAADE